MTLKEFKSLLNEVEYTMFDVENLSNNEKHWGIPSSDTIYDDCIIAKITIITNSYISIKVLT